MKILDLGWDRQRAKLFFNMIVGIVISGYFVSKGYPQTPDNLQSSAASEMFRNAAICAEKIGIDECRTQAESAFDRVERSLTP